MQTGVHMPLNLAHVPYCFADTYWCLRKGKIDQTEYIKRLVAHFGGIRHVDPDPVDENDSGICPSAVYDRFATAIRQVTVEKNYRPVRDLKSYEKLFHDCIENKYEDVITNVTKLRAKKPQADPTQPLAVLAAQHGHCKILQYCLDKGAVIDRSLANGMVTGECIDPGVEKLVKQHLKRILEVLETRIDENGDLAASEMEEFDDIEW